MRRIYAKQECYTVSRILIEEMEFNLIKEQIYILEYFELFVFLIWFVGKKYKNQPKPQKHSKTSRIEQFENLI